jgi:DNA-binding response OmpR family regulator
MNPLTEKTLLLVDDEPHMLRLLQFALRKTGAKILEATSGRAALNLAATQTVDLVVIDFMMPELDGFATLRELRRDPKYAKVPVIMLTSRGQLELRDTAEGLGIELFLTKPFSPAEMVQHVRRLLGADPAAS